MTKTMIKEDEGYNNRRDNCMIRKKDIIYFDELTALGVKGSGHTQFQVNDLKYHKNTLLFTTPKTRLYPISIVVMMC